MNTSKFEKAEGLTSFRLIFAEFWRRSTKLEFSRERAVVEELKNLGCKVGRGLRDVLLPVLAS